MKIFYGIAIFVCLSLSVSAQFDATWGYINAQQADSVILAVESEPNDTLNLEAFRKLGFYYQEYDDEKSLYFHERQLELAKKLKLQIWEADAYSQAANQLKLLGDIKKAHEYFKKAEAIASNGKSERPNWKVYSFSNARNEHEARIATLGMNYIMFGNFYRENKLHEKSISAYRKALELGQSVNNGKVIFFYYLNAHEYFPDSIPDYMQKALKWANISGYQKNNGWIFYHLCRYNVEINQIDSAKAYAIKSIASSKEQNLDPARIFSLLYLTRFYHDENKLDSALFCAKDAMLISKRNLPGYLAYAYHNLARTFASVSKLDSAYLYESKSRSLLDSLRTAKLDRMTDYQQEMFEQELQSRENENKQKLFLLIVGLTFVLMVALILYRNNRQKQNINKALESTLSNLKSTQAQLIQSEKMASLGELTAGIAHEIQNPLNFVNNFSEVSNELVDEMNEEIEKGDLEEAKAISLDIKQNLEKINHHGKRADAIVKGMLLHSRKSSADKEPTDINALADEYLRLSYHGLRAKDKSFNATLETDFDESIGAINVIPQDLGRVLLNLITNAFYACNSKMKSTDDSDLASTKASANKYKPTVSIQTLSQADHVKITVKDNGNGIPKDVIDKIFQPFFTTKPTGEGTGLGLSMSYDIITKGHGGELKVETKEGVGTSFIITIPKNEI